MIKLKCDVKLYHWGKVGSNSIVAKLKESSDPDFQINQQQHYAELWMGTHVSGPSLVMSGESEFENKPLSDILKKFPEYVGTIRVIKRHGKDLPFLFKVLSVGSPLSIQSHPDKELAQRLHQTHPDKYPDANHKPEMAIALTQFEALSGFRPHNEIESFLKQVPEFRILIGENIVNNYINCNPNDKRSHLKDCFKSLMQAKESDVQEQVKSIMKAFENKDEPVQKLVVRLNSHYPGDIGIFVAFFLNHVVLEPGEALFLAANEPHAYLQGDCVECMACSDNVIRAGLTPKFKDVVTLCDSLTYSTYSVEEVKLKPIQTDAYITKYVGPVDEFIVDAIQINAMDLNQFTLEAMESGSIVITIRGNARYTSREVTTGSTFFIPAMLPITLYCIKSDLLMYRAYFR